MMENEKTFEFTTVMSFFDTTKHTQHHFEKNTFLIFQSCKDIKLSTASIAIIFFNA